MQLVIFLVTKKIVYFNKNIICIKSRKKIHIFNIILTNIGKNGDRDRREECERKKASWDECYIKVIESSQRVFLNFDPRSGGYEIRHRKMLPIPRDRMSQQSNDSYSSNETRKISQMLILFYKKKRRRLPREIEFAMHVQLHTHYCGKKHVRGFN